jgi:hypothetical protein
MPVFKPDHARSPQARRVEAQEFVEEAAACRIGPAFRHELKSAPRPPPVRYYGTTRECQSIEAPQGWGGLRTVRRERLMSRIDVKPKLRTAAADVAIGRFVCLRGRL